MGAPPSSTHDLRSRQGIKVTGQFRDTFTLMTVMPFLKYKRGPLADPCTPVRTPRWRTRLFRDRSTATPTIEAIGARSTTPPMDAIPIYEEEVYETNIAGIGSGMGPSTVLMQRICIPPASPALSRTVTPKRGTNQGPNIILVEVSEVRTSAQVAETDDRLLNPS